MKALGERRGSGVWGGGDLDGSRMRVQEGGELAFEKRGIADVHSEEERKIGKYFRREEGGVTREKNF